MLYFDSSRARFALAISSSLALSTWGYARSREASVSTTAAATATRVNHLLSAGTTYHGLCFVAGFLTMILFVPQDLNPLLPFTPFHSVKFPLFSRHFALFLKERTHC